MAETGRLSVLLVWACGQGQVQEQALQLPAGACLRDALVAGGQACWPGDCGVWGRIQPPDYLLQAGDRVECYQPLLVDPKVARRERFAKQGARGAGLFSNRRPNSKSGY